MGINPAPRKILKSGDGGDQIGDQIRSNLTRFDRLSNRAVECETVRFDRSVPFGVISTIYPQTGRTSQIYENRIKSASNENHIASNTNDSENCDDQISGYPYKNLEICPNFLAHKRTHSR